jgi:hypothetical protein
VTGQAGQAPGVVKVRLLGAVDDITAVAGLLTARGGQPDGHRPGPRDASADACWAAEDDARRVSVDCGWQVIDRSVPYPNRRDSGARLYLTLTITHAGGRPRDE